MIQDLNRLKADGDYFREQLGSDRGFLITYDVVSPESAEKGDTEDVGYAGYHSCGKDEFDIEEGKSAVDLAVAYLKERGAVPASTGYHSSGWYTDADGDIDFRSGKTTTHHYHPTNFSEEEKKQLFLEMARQ